MGWMLMGNRVPGVRDESEWERERRERAQRASSVAVEVGKKSPERKGFGVGEKIVAETMRRLEVLNEERKREAAAKCSQVDKCVDKSGEGMTETEERLADFLGAAEAVVSSDKGVEWKETPVEKRAVFPELPLGVAENPGNPGKRRRKRRRKSGDGHSAEG